MERALFILKFVGVVVTIVAGIVRILPYFEQPNVIYATKDIASYPVAYHESEASSATEVSPADVRAKVLVGKPILIQGLLIQNLGNKTATDILVRIPIAESDGYAGGWIARGDNPVTTYMRDQVTEYKFDKLVPGESVSFYLYLKNSSSNLAARMQVFDGSGRLAPYYPYVPLRAHYEETFLFQIPKWFVYLLMVVMLILLIPAKKDIQKVKQFVNRFMPSGAARSPPAEQQQKPALRRKGIRT